MDLIKFDLNLVRAQELVRGALVQSICTACSFISELYFYIMKCIVISIYYCKNVSCSHWKKNLQQDNSNAGFLSLVLFL